MMHINVRKSGRLLAVIITTLLLGACAGGATRPGPVTPQMSDKDYLAAAPEDREAYLKAIKDEQVALATKLETEYRAGRPVTRGTSATGYTMQWDSFHKIVYIYPGHNPGSMSIESESVMAYLTNEDGDILVEDTPAGSRPVKLLANVATQTGANRMLIQAGAQVFASGVNGALAAKIAADANDCDGCGGLPAINVNSQASSGSIAEAVGTGNSTAVTGSCPSGGCLSVPLK